MFSFIEIYADKVHDATNGEREKKISTDIESTGRQDLLVAETNHLVRSR